MNDTPTGFMHKQQTGFKDTPQQNGAIINVFWGNNQGSFYLKALKHCLSGKANLAGFKDSSNEEDIHMPSPPYFYEMIMINTDRIRKQT